MRAQVTWQELVVQVALNAVEIQFGLFLYHTMPVRFLRFLIIRIATVIAAVSPPDTSKNIAFLSAALQLSTLAGTRAYPVAFISLTKNDFAFKCLK